MRALCEQGTVLINFNQWNTTPACDRPSQAVSLKVATSAGNVKVVSLNGPGASWSDVSWNCTDGKLVQSGQRQTMVLRPEYGKVNIDIESTEAIVFSLCESTESMSNCTTAFPIAGKRYEFETDSIDGIAVKLSFDL